MVPYINPATQTPEVETAPTGSRVSIDIKCEGSSENNYLMVPNLNHAGLVPVVKMESKSSIDLKREKLKTSSLKP